MFLFILCCFRCGGSVGGEGAACCYEPYAAEYQDYCYAFYQCEAVHAEGYAYYGGYDGLEVVVDAYDGGAQKFLAGHHSDVGKVGRKHYHCGRSAPFRGADCAPRRAQHNGDAHG